LDAILEKDAGWADAYVCLGDIAADRSGTDAASRASGALILAGACRVSRSICKFSQFIPVLLPLYIEYIGLNG